jgi:hypothetical protein
MSLASDSPVIPVVSSFAETPWRLRRKRRRAPTRVVSLVALITHVVTLVITAAALSALDPSVACVVIAVTAFLASVARLFAGALRFPQREVDVCWLVFHASVMFWFCFPGFTRSLQDNWYKSAAMVLVTPVSFTWAWVAIVVFVAGFDLLYALIRPGQTTRDFLAGVLGDTVKYRPQMLLGLMACLAVAVFVNYLVLAGGIGPLVDNLLALRGSDYRPWSSDGNYSTRLSTFHAITESLIVIVCMVSGDLCLNGRLKGRARHLGFAVWLFTVGFETLLSAGTRSVLALTLCAPLSLYVRSRLLGQLGVRRLAGLMALAVALLWFSSFLRGSRTAGLTEQQETSFVYQDDVDYVAATALSYDIFRLNGEDPYRESAMWMILVNPVPRWLWKGKPEPKIIVTYSWWDWGVDVSVVGGNSLPSMVGQSLLSWGWIGVVLTGFGWGFMAALGDAAIRDIHEGWSLIVWGLITWWMFTAFRFAGPSFFTAPYVLLILLNAKRLQKVFTRIHYDLDPSLRPKGSSPALPPPDEHRGLAE